jgi:superfamily II DNA/RNA helicase
MPHRARHPRASSERSGSGERRSRRGPARSRSGRASRPAQAIPRHRAEPRSELDLALDAAAAAPQPAAATFAELGLDDRLVGALAAREIREPFAIQVRVLPDALSGRDVLGRAQTGSGKTLAFGLPLLDRLTATTGRRRPKAPRGLILVPTRELAQQVADVLGPLGRRVGASVTTVYGGVPIGGQITRVRDADVVVATPGRLIDLMERHACGLDNIEITVLDEADHMADLGFMPAVTRILDATPPGGQRMFFSATLDREVGRLVTAYARDPALHAVTPAVDSGPAEHRVLVLSPQDKVAVATEIAGRPGRTLFFVRTKYGADRLAKQLSRAGVEAAAIHGDRNQNQRQRALDGFTAGRPRVLVATDVAARGIHVDDVDLVVQFDPPNDHKDYLHRSGRTARAGASGLVVALAGPDQVRDLRRLHEAAGITAATHEVTPGHHVVRQIATSGTPVLPGIQPREKSTRGSATPARRPQNSRRGQAASRFADTARPQKASRAHGAPRPRRANRAA